MSLAEADKLEKINQAQGEATALLAVAEARAKGLQIVSESLGLTDGKNAASFSIAEQYVKAFNKLAKTNNTLILPSNVGDVSGFVAQAMSIYKQILPPNPPGPQTHYERKSLPESDADEVYEYFSDKEEAEKHRNTNKARKS